MGRSIFVTFAFCTLILQLNLDTILSSSPLEPEPRDDCKYTTISRCKSDSCEDEEPPAFDSSCLLAELTSRNSKYRDDRCEDLCVKDGRCEGYLYERVRLDGDKYHRCKLYSCTTLDKDEKISFKDNSGLLWYEMQAISWCELTCYLTFEDGKSIQCPGFSYPGGEPVYETPSGDPTPKKCDSFKIEEKKLPKIVTLDENGYRRTPVMGFNGWFWTKRTYTADQLIQVAKDFKDRDYAVNFNGKKTTYKDAGYDYIMNDGGWWNGADWDGPLEIPSEDLAIKEKNIGDISLIKEGDLQGATLADPARYPKGVADLVDTIHDMGYKYGHYHNAGSNWCNFQKPSGYGKAEVNMKQLFSWDVDYIKLDACGIKDLYKPARCEKPFSNSKNCAALNAWVKELDELNKDRKEKVLLTNCRIGCMGHKSQREDERCNFKEIDNDEKWRKFWKIPKKTSASSWCSRTYMARTSSDTRPCWGSMMNAIYAGLNGADGQFYDPDLILIGLNKRVFTNPDPQEYGLSLIESKTNFALFAIMSYPLILSTDVSTLPSEYAEILLNRWAIWVNQNIIQGGKMKQKLKQGYRIVPDDEDNWRAKDNDYITVWWKPLDDDYNAFAILNQAFEPRTNIEYSISELLEKANGLIGEPEALRKVGQEYQILNIFTNEQSTGVKLTADKLEGHECLFVLVKTLCAN